MRFSCSSTVPGNLQAHIATSAIKPPLHSTALMLPVVNQRNANEDDITITIAYLPLVGNTLFCVQLVKNGPKCLWLYNQSCIRLLDLANAQAAITKNILNGIPGTTTPT